MDPRSRMTSGFGLLAIDDELDAAMSKQGCVIATDLTGELTPSGSACADDSADEGGGELTRTLSALQRLSVQEQTTLSRKLGHQASGGGHNKENANTSSSVIVDDDDSVAGGLLAAVDSPFRIVLQKAVVQGDLAAVTAALQSGADPNERDDLRHSSLHFAAAKGDLDCLKKLMNSGARANVANNVGWSPLHYAVLGGHVAAVEALLRAGAYPCFRDNHLISPLHLASTQAGDRETFQKIAELLGPSALLARDELEQTPLHVAASCGNRAAVAVLLELNADPEAKDRKGREAGQSFLRQVSKRARADIRASLAAAVVRRNAPDVTEEEEGRVESVAAAVKAVMKRAGSSCEEAAPVRRPSLPSMMNLLPAWGGLGGSNWGGGGGGGDKAGETSFGGGAVLVPAES